MVLQPGSEGYDAWITNNQRYDGRNFGDSYFFKIQSWTDNEHGSPQNENRSLIKFSGIDGLKASKIINANMVLYGIPDFPMSQDGENSIQFCRVTSPWNEQTVKWDNQPSFVESNSVFVPRNNDFDSLTVNVTSLVKDMLNNDNYGFLIKHQVENTPYKRIVFSSSDYETSSRRPKLIIEF